MLDELLTALSRALGVLAITIHHATGLSAQDRGGKSDPYLVLAYAKFGKPLYSSRIILGDCECLHILQWSLAHLFGSKPCLGRDCFSSAFR